MHNFRDFNDAQPAAAATRQGPGPDADDIRARINANIVAFLRYLFANAVIIGKAEARLGNVQGDVGESLSISLRGDSIGQWIDHATGEGGDLLTLYMARMGYSPDRDFDRALREIAATFLGDRIECHSDVNERLKKHHAATKVETERKRKAYEQARRDGVETIYEYRFKEGDEPVIRQIRIDYPQQPGEAKPGKTFQIRPSGYTGPLPFYRQPELDVHDGIVLVEGEKCVGALWDVGIPATTMAGGSNAKVDRYDWSIFKGKKVLVWRDNDPAGEGWEKRVIAELKKAGAIVIRLPVETKYADKKEGYDAADALAVDPDRQLEVINYLRGLEDKGEGEAEAGSEALLLSSADFVRGFIPPDYLIKGLIQRRFIYSVTAPTGAGKTAAALLLSSCVALEKPFGDRAVKSGRVLYFAGENPDDIRMRWIGMAHHDGFDPMKMEVFFIPGTLSLKGMIDRVRAETQALGGVSLIIIDTGPAFFEGTDENDNKQMGDHGRLLRSLTTMPGGPAVLVLAHPVKNAGPDNLLPRGGGAFLNEVDGNFTITRDGTVMRLHWQGKFRGPDFNPISLELIDVSPPTLKDSDGALIPTVVAAVLSAQDERAKEQQTRSREEQLLRAMRDNPDSSYTALLDILGWKSKATVSDTMTRLMAEGFVQKKRSRYFLTKKGEAEVIKAETPKWKP